MSTRIATASAISPMIVNAKAMPTATAITSVSNSDRVRGIEHRIRLKRDRGVRGFVRDVSPGGDLRESGVGKLDGGCLPVGRGMDFAFLRTAFAIRVRCGCSMNGGRRHVFCRCTT